MDTTDQTLQVFVIADDPIEAGMLALDLVHAGLAAQAVRDVNTLLQQVYDTRGGIPPVVVSAFRDLDATLDLTGRLEEVEAPSRIIAVVLRAQRDAAERQSRAHQWAGVAVRPVNAEELVALARAQESLRQAEAGGAAQEGELAQHRLLDTLQGLIDRIPRPGGGKNALLSLESHGRLGKIAVVEGELLHAEADGETGRHALERMACWRTGTWRLEPQVWTSAPTLTGSSIGLLAVAQEYARRVDEARASLPYTDCKCTVRWERVRPLPVVAEGMFRRIAAGTVLADALAGEGDDELEAYAALENRIKRGAVVPQIDTAPAAPLNEDVGPTTSGATPVGRVATSFLSAGLPSAAATGTTANQGARTPASEPSPRRGHPATHLYRLNDAPADGSRPQSDMPPAFPVSADSLPPALPDRPMNATTAQFASGVLRTNSASALDTSRYNSVENAARRGAITGWFGVAVAEGDESVSPDNAPLRSSARAADLRSSGSFRSTPRPGEGEAPKLSARPYAWSPEPAPHKTEDQSDLVKLPTLAQTKPQLRWPWLVAGLGAIAAIVVTLVSPGAGRKPARPLHGQDYRRAANLIEAGEYDGAIKRLQAAVQGKDVEPDALLSLGVLEVEARQFVSGRAHLDQYLALPDARHADRARKLYLHVFGEAPPAPSAGAAPAATPSAG